MTRVRRGAALLTALVIVSLVATLAAALLWRQQRAIAVEAADRARAQAAWVLGGALDWARLILATDGRSNSGGRADHLGEVWAVPLAESRLSTFLAAEQNAAESEGPEAFLSGAIEDAQARYNLRQLLKGDQLAAIELGVLARLAESAQVSASLAEELARRLRAACKASPDADDAPVCPAQVEQLAWLGLDPEGLARLSPFITLLPIDTPVNLNTASREVLAAVLGIDLASADQLLQQRRNRPFRDLETVKTLLPNVAPTVLVPERCAVHSQMFVVTGRLRLDERVIEQRSLLQRLDSNEIRVLRRDRANSLSSRAPGAS